LWPRSGKQEWATQAPSVIAACGPDLHATSARCGPDLGRNNVAMWVVLLEDSILPKLQIPQ